MERVAPEDATPTGTRPVLPSFSRRRHTVVLAREVALLRTSAGAEIVADGARPDIPAVAGGLACAPRPGEGFGAPTSATRSSGRGWTISMKVWEIKDADARITKRCACEA